MTTSQSGRLSFAFFNILKALNIFLVIVFIFNSYAIWFGLGRDIRQFLPVGIPWIILGYVSLGILFQAWRSLFRFNRYFELGSQIFFVVVNIFLTAYLFRVKIPFEYAVIAVNADEGFSLRALQIELDSIHLPVFFTALFVATAITIAYSAYVRSVDSFVSKDSKTVSMIWIAVAAVLIVSPIPDLNLPINFIRSIYKFYATGSAYPPLPKTQFPLLKEWQDPTPPLVGEKPNIVVILVESLNAEILNKRSNDGREITPFLNQLETQGWFFPRFYGNSVQSAKGVFSVLGSTIPSTQSKEFVRYGKMNYLTVSSLLQQSGYATFWLQGDPHLNYDRSHDFANRKEMGIDVHEAVPVKNQTAFGSWGPRDIFLYQYFFDWIQSKNKDKKPVFVLLTTIYSHQPYFVPPKDRKIFPNPNSRYENYANAIHLVDQDLEWFLNRLLKDKRWKNTVVIITGDHSTPIGTQTLAVHPQSGSGEDAFRTPAWIIWPGVLRPKVINTRRSQLDIAPTILDIVDAKPHQTPFVGKTLLQDIDVPIYLVQPYLSGRIASVSQDGWKLVFNVQDRRYAAYRLPDETVDRLSELKSNTQTYNQLYQNIQTILLNQRLIHNNRIYPGPQPQRK